MTDTGATDALARALESAWMDSVWSKGPKHAAPVVAAALAALGYEVRLVERYPRCLICGELGTNRIHIWPQYAAYHDPEFPQGSRDLRRPVRAIIDSATAEAADREAAGREQTVNEAGPSAAADPLGAKALGQTDDSIYPVSHGLAVRWGLCSNCGHSPGNHSLTGTRCYVRVCGCAAYAAAREAAS